MVELIINPINEPVIKCMIEPMVDSMEKFEPMDNFKPKYSQLKVILEERVSSQKP